MDKMHVNPIGNFSKIRKEEFMFRPFTENTKILIVMYINEGRHTLGQIAQELNRDINDLTDKIIAMRISDEFQRIHLNLMEYGGSYARKNKDSVPEYALYH